MKKTEKNARKLITNQVLSMILFRHCPTKDNKLRNIGIYSKPTYSIIVPDCNWFKMNRNTSDKIIIFISRDISHNIYMWNTSRNKDDEISTRVTINFEVQVPKRKIYQDYCNWFLGYWKHYFITAQDQWYMYVPQF